MKIACISDVHGNPAGLAAALSRIPYTVEKVLFLGDICGYYPLVEECVQMLQMDNLIAVRGNHDQLLIDCIESQIEPGGDYERRYGSALRRCIPNLSDESKQWVSTLPISLTVDLEGATVSLFHGSPWDILGGRVYPDFEAWDEFSETEADIIILGQTHYPLVKQLDHQLIVNPGSVGQPRDRSGAACFAVVDTDSWHVDHHRVAFDASSLIKDVREEDPSIPYLAEVLVR